MPNQEFNLIVCQVIDLPTYSFSQEEFDSITLHCIPRGCRTEVIETGTIFRVWLPERGNQSIHLVTGVDQANEPLYIEVGQITEICAGHPILDKCQISLQCTLVPRV